MLTPRSTRSCIRSCAFALTLMCSLCTGCAAHDSSPDDRSTAVPALHEPIDLVQLSQEVPTEWLPQSPDEWRWSQVDRAKLVKWLYERLLGRQVTGRLAISGTGVSIPQPGSLQWQIEFQTPGVSSDALNGRRVVFSPGCGLTFLTSDEALVRRLEDFGLEANRTEDGNFPSVRYTGIVTGIDVGTYIRTDAGPAGVYFSLSLKVQSVDVATSH